MYILAYSANFLPIIHYNGCRIEEHSMEINLAGSGQPVQLSRNQDKRWSKNDRNQRGGKNNRKLYYKEE